MSKPVITVVGATGNQGRSVCNAFNRSGQWQVRALTRNPAGPVAQQFAREGIQVVRGDFTVKSDLLRAFSGSYAVYGISLPPWQHSSQNYAHTLTEFEQGCLQADAAKAAGVNLFLWSTLPYVGPTLLGLGGVDLLDMKARVDQYVKSIGLPAVFVSLCVFLENVLDWPLMKLSSDGQTLECWDYTLSPETPVSFVWIERDLGPSVLTIANTFATSSTPPAQNPLNHTTQVVASFRASYGEVFRTIGKALGVPIKHTVYPSVDARWHPDLTKCFIYQEKHGFYPNAELPNPTLRSLRVQYGTLDEFVSSRVAPRFKR